MLVDDRQDGDELWSAEGTGLVDFDGGSGRGDWRGAWWGEGGRGITDGFRRRGGGGVEVGDGALRT